MCSQRWPGSPACAPDRPGVPTRHVEPQRPGGDAAQRSTSSSICANCCMPPMCQAPMFWSVTPSAAWLPASMRPFARAGSPASCRSTHRMRTSSPGTGFLTPEQYLAAVLDLSLRQVCRPTRQSSDSAEISTAQVRQAQADTHCAGCRSRSSPLPRPCEPVRLPARLADQRPRTRIPGIAGHACRTRAGRTPCDRRQEWALHSAGSAQTGDPNHPGDGP